MSTADNLRLAFTEEAKNRALYQAFAVQADAEGKPQAARMFRALADSEQVHGRAELELMGNKGSTVENVRFAIGVEEREFQDLYARFLVDARKEGNEEVARLMENILKVERAHYELLRETLTELLDKDDIAPTPIFVCGTCGNTVVGRQTEACSICGAPSVMFVEIP
jgi:rubrerythrin